MQTNTEFPRVELPGTTDEDRAKIEALHDEMEWNQRTSTMFLRALLLKGVRPFVGVAKPAKKPTKHQRHMANVKARSAYLKTVA
jgi:hypothetical protein